MALLGDRLSYILDYLTPRQVLNETGFNVQDQREILAGTYDPTGYSRTFINRLYQRTTYAVMRNTGFSASQALRFTNQTPDNIRDKTLMVSDLVSNLAVGALQNKLTKQGLSYDVYSHRDLLSDMEDRIAAGLQRSRKTYEQWFDYGRT